MMKRSVLALAATGATAAALAVPVPAQAAPGSIQLRYTNTQTSVMFRSGTGIIRAWQYCQSSSGQTNWYSYGPWVGIGRWSTTGSCTVILRRGYNTSNPVA
ncbi:hypothetical protein WEI85_20200 [Actinomycetes bacterium KLBMP 9797]